MSGQVRTAATTELHCRRCNQQLRPGEQYAESRTHGVRVAVHVACNDPSTWTQCAKLSDETNEQCQAIATDGAGYCASHSATRFTRVEQVYARERVTCVGCGGFLFRMVGTTRNACRDCLHLGYGSVE